MLCKNALKITHRFWRSLY